MACLQHVTRPAWGDVPDAHFHQNGTTIRHERKFRLRGRRDTLPRHAVRSGQISGLGSGRRRGQLARKGSMRLTGCLGIFAGAAPWVLLLCSATDACAVPRYAARYGQTCALCHVNPSGGGLRTPYASQKLVPEEIAWSRATPPALEEIDPMIAKHIMIGTDFREFYIGANLLEARANFFEMQADLYFGFQLDPRVTLYYDRGQSNSYELFGLDYLLPTFYVKAGRFVPSYGWKFDDHTMFVRSELGFMPPANSDVGVEAGWSKGSFDIQASLVNGNRGSTLDNDLKMAGLLNAIYRHRVGPV